MDQIVKKLKSDKGMKQEDELQLNGSLDSFTFNFASAPSNLDLKPFPKHNSDQNCNQSIVCSECGIVIRNLTNLSVHMRRHFTYKPFICSECSYSGYDEDDVRRHINRTHPALAERLRVQFHPDSEMEASVQELINKTKTFRANSEASAAYPSPSPELKSSATDKNLPRIDPASAVHCSLCNGAVQKQPVDVLKHLKCHVRFRGFPCPSCFVPNPSWMDLVTHLEQSHASESQLNRWCQESRTLLSEAFVSLARVAFKGLNQPSVTCVQCKVDVKWADLKEHALKEAGCKSWVCQECGESFISVEAGIKHREASHPRSFLSLSFNPELCPELKTESRWACLEKCFPVLTAESVEGIRPAVVEVSGGASGRSLDDSRRRLSSSSTEDASKKVLIECRLCCSQISRNMSCLIAHAKVHLAYKPMKCAYCHFRHFAMSKIRRHNSRVHPNKMVKVSYHPVADIARQIKEMKHRCFGAQASSTVWGQNPELDESEVIHSDHEDSGLIDDDDEDSLDPSGALPVTLNSPLPTEEHQTPRNDSSPGVSTTQVASYMQNPHVSKLLEQLMGGNNSNNSSDVSSFSSMIGVDTSMSSRGSGIFPQMTSPEPGMLTPRSSAGGETYDLTGMGKKVCSVCNTYIANNPSSFDNHACKHLDYKPYYCHYCQYQSYIRGKVTRHIQQVHHGLPVKINHRPIPGIKDKIQSIKMKCFPFLIGGGDSAGEYSVPSGIVRTNPSVPCAFDEVQCRMCDLTVMASEVSMDEHLQIHIPVKYYHCPVCTYQTTYLIRAKQHVHSAHPTSQETRILCCPPEGMRGLHLLRVKCFGASVWSPASVSEAEQQNYGSTLEGPDPLPVVTADEDESLQGFPEGSHQSNNSTGTSAGGRISCGVCKALVSNLPAAIGTHVRNHLTDYRPYQCSYCVWKSSSEAEVKVHISASHKNVPLRVIYNPERAELQKMQERCFPSLRNFTMSNPESQVSTSSVGSTLLKKLICQLCKNTIADNPKSVGIHVKNHLNYKPYRCPFCKYMSCEQSKARRHVEHVHSVSGDTVEIHAEEGIKERILDMKGRCFPTLLSDSTYSLDSPEGYMGGIEESFSSTTDASQYKDDSQIQEEWTCKICREAVGMDVLDSHVRSHLGKPFKCGYCTSRFWTEERVRGHIQAVHPLNSLRFFNQSSDLENQMNSIRGRCFPELVQEEAPQILAASFQSEPRSESPYPAFNNNNSIRMKSPGSEGKLKCRVCEQWVSCNPNSLEVHAKTHLNFKQHQCGYCNYRSCIAGKVKRHLDNVHRGQEVSMLSFTALSSNIKQIIADMRSTCFPQIEGDHATKSRQEVSKIVMDLKTRLIQELHDLPNSALDMDPTELTAALAAAQAARTPGNGNPVIPISTLPDSRNSTPLPPPTEQEDDFGENASSRGTETPLDPGFGKIQCQQCGTYVADNPSSLGLHVRNHLDYKPFSCNLCDYKSCIQAKVKRHLRNVHKCPTDEMTYSPEADIRLKVMDMKLKCFPKMLEAAESAMNGGQQPTANGNSPSTTHDPAGGGEVRRNVQNLETVNNLLDAMLGVKGSAASIIAELNSGNGRDVEDIIASAREKQTEELKKLQCRLCSEFVPVASKENHLSSHSGESQWHCSDCGFGSFIQETVREHAESNHPGQTAQAIRFGSGITGSMTEEEYGQLRNECFPGGGSDEMEKGDVEEMEDESGIVLGEEELGDDEDDMEMDLGGTSGMTSAVKRNGTDGPRYICQLCGQAVSMYASSLYVHVKNHMNYKPYCCGHCDYRSPVKSKVRRHIQNAHRKLPMTINYFPTPGIDHEVLRMKKKCFPDVTSFATLTNDKIPCLKCKTDVADTPLSKSVHAKNHLNSKPYHCGYCTYRSCLKGETRRHVSRQHRRRPMRIIFRSEEVVEREEVDGMIRQCFLNSCSDMDSSGFGGDLEEDVESEEEPTQSLSVEQARSAVASVQPVEGSETAVKIKLGPAYREWYCPYCSFSDTSKYHVKEHCLSDHPGKKVHVAANLEQVNYLANC